MKERPVLFSGPMVLALLAGRKTMTRRVVADPWVVEEAEDDGTPVFVHRGNRLHPCEYACGGVELQCGGLWYAGATPYGVPGDRLWVREAWRVPADLDDLSGSGIASRCGIAGYSNPWTPIRYEADGRLDNQSGWRSWRPGHEVNPGRYRHARFMPRWTSRITLEITEIRVQRVQHISETDAQAEGVEQLDEVRGSWTYAFSELWDSINEKRGFGWKKNPWVWVIEFKRIEVTR